MTTALFHIRQLIQDMQRKLIFCPAGEFSCSIVVAQCQIAKMRLNFCRSFFLLIIRKFSLMFKQEHPLFAPFYTQF